MALFAPILFTGAVQIIELSCVPGQFKRCRRRKYVYVCMFIHLHVCSRYAERLVKTYLSNSFENILSINRAS